MTTSQDSIPQTWSKSATFFIIFIALTSACNVVYDYDELDYRSLKNYGSCPEKDDWGRVWHKLCHGVVGRIYKTDGSCYKVMDVCWGCLDNPSLYDQHQTKHPVRLQRLECDECPVCPGLGQFGDMCSTLYGNMCNSHDLDSIVCVPLVQQCKLDEWTCGRFQECDSKHCADVVTAGGHTEFQIVEVAGYPFIYWEAGLIQHNINEIANKKYPYHKWNLEIQPHDFDEWYFVWTSSKTKRTYNVQMHDPQTVGHSQVKSFHYMHKLYYRYKISWSDCHEILNNERSFNWLVYVTIRGELVNLIAPELYEKQNSKNWFELYVGVVMFLIALTMALLTACALFGFMFGFGFISLHVKRQKEEFKDHVTNDETM